MQVVAVNVLQLQPAGRFACPASRRGDLIEQVACSTRFGNLAQAIRLAAVEHAAATLPSIRPDIHQPLRAAHQVQVVLHHEHRVAGVAQPVERVVQGLAIGGVQARGGLVEHVHDTEQQGTQLRGQPQALQLAGRKRRRGPVQRQVAQAQPTQLAQACHHATGQALRGEALFFR